MDAENKSITVRAATVEAAITQGLARLGVSSDQVKIEVLDEGSRGLLGLGAREAVVRLVPVAVAPSVEPAPSLPAEEPVIPPAIREAERPKATRKAEPESAEFVARAAPKPIRQSAEDTARDVLSELLSLMGIRAQVEVRRDQDTPTGPDAPPFVLDILGNDLGVLIGRHGQTLQDLQFMTRLIVSREVGEWVNLVIDVEKYKVRREKQLQQLAERLAERVVLTQQSIALEPMPPHERRIIHVTLRNHPIITTESVGRGDRRKVTIIPRR